LEKPLNQNLIHLLGPLIDRKQKIQAELSALGTKSDLLKTGTQTAGVSGNFNGLFSSGQIDGQFAGEQSTVLDLGETYILNRYEFEQIEEFQKKSNERLDKMKKDYSNLIVNQTCNSRLSKSLDDFLASKNKIKNLEFKDLKPIYEDIFILKTQIKRLEHLLGSRPKNQVPLAYQNLLNWALHSRFIINYYYVKNYRLGYLYWDNTETLNDFGADNLNCTSTTNPFFTPADFEIVPILKW
jgi:hypothetical protein